MRFAGWPGRRVRTSANQARGSMSLKPLDGQSGLRMIRRRHCILIEPRVNRRSAIHQQTVRSHPLISAAERARFCPTAINTTAPTGEVLSLLENLAGVHPR
jgi:hypothetical protein